MGKIKAVINKIKAWLIDHKRRLKQIGYGALYLIALTAVSASIYYFYFVPVGSCFDNIQNQDEAGVDCGGLSCIDCELKNLKLQFGAAKAFKAGESKSTIVAEIINPSSNYVLKNFEYELQLLNQFGMALPQKLQGSSYILPAQKKYLVAPAVNIPIKDISQVKVSIPAENWEPKAALPVYNLRFADVKTTLVPGAVQVAGRLVNDSSSGFFNLVLIAVLFDKNNEVINASTTRMDMVPAFSENQFTVFFPSLNASEVNLGATKVFYEVSR